VDIYQLFNEMARSGKAVIIFSTDYSEILGICSRITAMRNGTVVREYKKDEVSRQDLLKTIFGAQSA
jgi:ABC-type sugar transport system ATPase subunit